MRCGAKYTPYPPLLNRLMVKLLPAVSVSALQGKRTFLTINYYSSHGRSWKASLTRDCMRGERFFKMFTDYGKDFSKDLVINIMSPVYIQSLLGQELHA